MKSNPGLKAAIEAKDAGRWAIAARLLRPLAESGLVEAQSILGCLMLQGLHRFASTEELDAWYDNAGPEDVSAFKNDLEPDIRIGLQWLHIASDSGNGPASHNLAMAYLNGAGELTPEQRREKVKTLLTKARQQGFSFFGGGDSAEAYLETLEHYAKERGIGMPWEDQANPASED